MAALSRLFSPIKIGSVELKNRIVMAPMGIHMSDLPRTLGYFEARARGGVGMIVLPDLSDSPIPTPGAPPTEYWGEKVVTRVREVVKAVHAHGAKAVPQIGHPGSGFRPVTVLSLDDIKKIIEDFGYAAMKAREIGCDGVELHAAHGWMALGSFISALKNRRTDAYGGSIEGRLKLPLEVISSVREKVGKDFPILLRLSADELTPGGRDIRETQYIAPMLAEAGVSLFDLSIGVFGHPHMAGVTGMGTPRGFDGALSKVVKEVVDVPVMVVGRINDARLAESMLRMGETDLVMMGRALLADPELPNKAAQGSFEDIAPCVGCSLGCAALPGESGVTCLVNPALTREKEMAITKAAKPKKVLVVGGGPGGMEAARVAALRGHDVTLCEKGACLGGQLNLAAVPPMKQEITRVTQYLSVQMEKAEVKLQLNREVTPELVAEMKPDAVIIASGSEPIVPDIPGVKGEKVVTAHDVLNGRVMVNPGKVVIIGGGIVGCEVADQIANLGYNRVGTRVAVTVVEMLEEVVVDLPQSNRADLLERLRQKEVKILTSTKVKDIGDGSVTVVRDGQEEAINGIDLVILAVGVRPVDNLSGKIKDKVAEVYVIGDAKQPRSALEAIGEAAEAGRSI